MLIEEYKLLDSYEPWPLDIPKEQVLFFDIETTGLSPKHSHLYIIGCGYYKEHHWHIKQWFAENSSEEFLILENFLSYSKAFDMLITYNGSTFDLPYTKEKTKGYLLADILPKTRLDLFQKIKPFQKFFSLQHLHQTDIERFLGLYREDQFSGKELIAVYHNYQKTQSDTLLHPLLLHNKEDLSGMLTCMHMLSYITIFEGKYQYANAAFDSKQCVFSFTLNDKVVRTFTHTCPHGSIHLKNDTFIVTLPIKEYKLKYYFPDYENYVILSREHTVIPKKMAKSTSLSTTNATLDNCYQELMVTDKLIANEKKVIAIVNNYLIWLLRYIK